MVLYKFTGGTPALASEVNNNISRSLRASAINLIRQQTDRSVNSDARNGEYSEAYTDANGRNNTVDTVDGSHTAFFDSNYGAYYSPIITDLASGDSTSDPDGFTSPGNAFDGDDSTAATKSVSASGSTTVTLGKTFSAETIEWVRYKCSLTDSIGLSSVSVKLQTYNGSTWDDAKTITTTVADNTFYGYHAINASVQGVRISFTGNFTPGVSYTWSLHTLEYGAATEAVVVHDIPTGTFSSTISSAFCDVHAVNWDSTSNAQFKLINGTDDTGWLNCGEIHEFTAFAAGEPTQLLLKLIPASSSPSVPAPSVYGVAVFE